MLFVKLGENEYLPFLHKDSIRLKDQFSNTVLLSESSDLEFLVKDIEAVFEGGANWFLCDYFKLRSLLESKEEGLSALRECVRDGSMVRNLRYMSEMTVDVTV